MFIFSWIYKLLEFLFLGNPDTFLTGFLGSELLRLRMPRLIVVNLCRIKGTTNTLRSRKFIISEHANIKLAPGKQTYPDRRNRTPTVAFSPLGSKILLREKTYPWLTWFSFPLFSFLFLWLLICYEKTWFFLTPCCCKTGGEFVPCTMLKNF